MIKILKNFTYREVLLVLVVVVLTCLQTYLDLTLLDYMSNLTLLVKTDGSAMSDIYLTGGKMVACSVGSLLSAIAVAIIAAKVASNLSYALRKKLFGKVMNFSMQEVNNFSTSSLITRTTNDITQVQMLIVMGAQMLIKAPITAVWAIIKIANKNMSWTTVTIVAVVVLLLIVSICLSLAVPRFVKIQKLTDNINKVTREQLDGLPVVRAYNAEKYQENKFDKANKELTGVSLFTSRTMSFLMPSMQMISSGLVLSVYLVGTILISNAEAMDMITLFSDMVVFTGYGMQVVMSFMMLVMVFMILPRAMVSAKRINQVFDTQQAIVEGSYNEGIEEKIGEVEFKNVSFKYPGGNEYILSDISFSAKKGEVVAFIGSTGCGKTTAINLIPRFYDVSEGQVLVNGRNVKDYTKDALSGMIGYVSQKATLFRGSIKSNIAFGDNVDKNTDENGMQQSVDVAQANEFVTKQESGYDAYVSQGGSNLSGGQKQRLSIARAIYRKADIMIFDDSFSALDYKTDRKLRTALGENCSGSTRIVVGQRIGTIKDADKIIVLKDGNIVGMGKHNELLKNCEQYQKIALSQLSEEELSNG